MYAILSDGPHQYRVEAGQVLEVERKDLPEDAKTVEFERVLLVGDIEGGPRVGHPILNDAKVTASVLCEVKGKKIIIQKHLPRKNYRLKKGHRKKYLRVNVQKIEHPF